MFVIQSRVKWILVAGISGLLGFLSGSLSQFSVRRVNPFDRVNSGRVEQVSFADVAERVNASVVSVVSTKIVDLNQMHEDLEFWNPLKPDENTKRKSLGFGSGFILEGQGLIVTNQHVIDSSANVTVRLFDGSEYPAETLGTDEDSDLALMKIKPKKRLSTVKLGDSDKLRVGDWVMAVGDPFNYDHSVTVGVVSAKDRKIDDNPFERYIQTDAAINFGNSGGPLFNALGEVVAITTAISTKGRSIGFAIPINFARSIVGQLEEHGRVVRGYLGVTPESITENNAKVLQIGSAEGVVVAEVSPLSAAERAGIQRYDVITRIDGHPIKDKDDFFRKVAQTVPGTEIKISGIRNSQPVEFDLVVRERPPVAHARLVPDSSPLHSWLPPETKMARAGISVQELNDHHRKLYGIEGGKGLVIVEVDPISPAADVGLEVGDVVLEINKHPVASLMEYRKLIAGFKVNDAVMFLISRLRSGSRIVTLKLEGAS